MVALTLSSLILGGITSSYTFLLKCTASIGNYVQMNQTSRNGLEVFARDARMASQIFAMESNTFIFLADTESGPRLITYVFDSESKTVKRRVGLFSPFTEMLADVEAFSFKYYNLLGNLTTNVTEAKSVQINGKMRRRVLALSNTEEVISARFTMRNRIVSN